MPVPTKLQTSVDQAFSERNWRGKVTEDGGGRWIRSVAFTQPAWAAGVAVLFDPASGILTAYVGYPARIPERARGAIAEAITRANYGYVGACLELDFGNGDLRSRAALLIGAADASPEQVRDLLETAIDFCTKFSPAITEVLAGGEPAEAVARVRDPESSP